MSKTVLLITDEFIPHNNANGMCTYRYAKALIDGGYDVHVLSYRHPNEIEEETIEKISIHRCKPRLFYTVKFYSQSISGTKKGAILYNLAILIHRLKAVLLIFLYPLESIVVAERFYRKAKKIINEQGVNLVIAGFMPPESLYIGIKLKRKTSISLITVLWDTLTNTGLSRKSSIIYNSGHRWNLRLLKHSDAVIQLKTNSKQFESISEYKQFMGKIVLADIPFPPQNNLIGNRFVFDSQHVNILYNGGLSSKSENLRKAIRVFEMLDSKYSVHFYSRGDGELYLEKISDGVKIQRHGQVLYEQLRAAQSCTDAFLSIGPDDSSVLNIPSKIFEYISFGKIWMHFYSNNNDVSLEYVKKYPLGLAVNLTEDLDKITDKIESFFSMNLNKKLSREEVNKLFPLSSPEFIVQISNNVTIDI